MTQIVSTQLHENGEVRTYNTLLIHEFGQFGEGLDTRKKVASKVSDLWVEASQHDVLFTDFTRGDPEAFMDVFFDPLGVWLEIQREEDARIIGAVRLSRVLPKIDAEGHLTLWDAKAKDREPLAWDILEWIFGRYDLRRFTTRIPAFQRGVARFTKRLGFKQEGVRRKSRLHKGSWVDDICFGLLKEELEEVRDAVD